MFIPLRELKLVKNFLHSTEEARIAATYFIEYTVLFAVDGTGVVEMLAV